MRTKSLLTALVVAATVALAGTSHAATWTIDGNHSSVGFSIRHIFSKVQGSFDKFSGTVEFDPANPAAASVKVEIDPASINTRNQKRDDHLRSADFFDVAKFPAMSFTSTKVTKGEGNALTVEGDLTMHGVTKPVTLAVNFIGAGPAMGGQRAGFESAAKLDRKEFGIVWNKTLDTGTLLGDEVAMTIDVEAYVPGEQK